VTQTRHCCSVARVQMIIRSRVLNYIILYYYDHNILLLRQSVVVVVVTYPIEWRWWFDVHCANGFRPRARDYRAASRRGFVVIAHDKDDDNDNDDDDDDDDKYGEHDNVIIVVYVNLL